MVGWLVKLGRLAEGTGVLLMRSAGSWRLAGWFWSVVLVAMSAADLMEGGCLVRVGWRGLGLGRRVRPWLGWLVLVVGVVPVRSAGWLWL